MSKRDEWLTGITQVLPDPPVTHPEAKRIKRRQGRAREGKRAQEKARERKRRQEEKNRSSAWKPFFQSQRYLVIGHCSYRLAPVNVVKVRSGTEIPEHFPTCVITFYSCQGESLRSSRSSNKDLGSSLGGNYSRGLIEHIICRGSVNVEISYH